jgi:hypothetical protein
MAVDESLKFFTPTEKVFFSFLQLQFDVVHRLLPCLVCISGEAQDMSLTFISMTNTAGTSMSLSEMLEPFPQPVLQLPIRKHLDWK